MKPWQEEQMEAFLTIGSEQELFSHITQAAQSMGFEYCAYGVRVPVPVSRPGVAIFSNYSPQWQVRYHECGYIDVDPTVQHALRSTLPLVWSDQLFYPARGMWEEARAHGLQVGWAQAARDASGSVGLLTLARSSERLTSVELCAKQAGMVWLGQYAHVAMTRLLTPRMAPEAQVMLTMREKEVLRWTAEGKTAYEIAQILLVAERTITFHISNAMTKLRASNKTQAAVKATALGLLA